MIQFEWNITKSLSNFKKHGISFDTASSIFEDPHMLSWLDYRFEYGEERWTGLGLSNKTLLIVVIHTLRVNKNDEEIIRIISARQATQKEQAYYYSYLGKE